MQPLLKLNNINRSYGAIQALKNASFEVNAGEVMGLVGENGVLDLRYQHVDRDGVLMTGYCETTPEVLPNGKLRLHEKWRWTCGHRAKGRSTLDEI